MKNYEITEEQIKNNSEKTLKEWFSDVFNTELEVGKWKKTPKNGLYCPKEKTEDGFLCYGFDVTGVWREINVPISITKDDIDATDLEVLGALKNEFKKQNPLIEYDLLSYITYENKFEVKIKGIYYEAFKDGIWTKFHTKEKAEKLLNAKII